MTNEVAIIEFQVETTLPVLQSNFEIVKQHLAENLKRYEIEVTQQNLPDAKKMATGLNKISKQIDDCKKDKLKEIESPVNIFKEQVKELIQMCQDGRNKILEQVKVFEDITRALCLDLLKKELQEQYNKLNIKDEFKTVNIDDLIIISNVTDSNSLVKKAKDSINERVHCALSLQNTVKVRLVELENLCLKAGLKSPLERRHIEIFLKEEEDFYNQKLQSTIQREIERQKEIEKRIIAEEKKKAEIEMQRKLDEERIKIQAEERQKLQNEAKVREIETKPNSSEIPKSSITEESSDNDNQAKSIVDVDHDIFIITAKFEIKTPKGKVNEDFVKNKFTATLKDANFQSVKSVEVVKLV